MTSTKTVSWTFIDEDGEIFHNSKRGVAYWRDNGTRLRDEEGGEYTYRLLYNKHDQMIGSIRLKEGMTDPMDWLVVDEVETPTSNTTATTRPE